MNSLTQSIAAQFVMARSPMTTLVMGSAPSRTHASNGNAVLRPAISAIADAVKAFPILALQARKQ